MAKLPSVTSPLPPDLNQFIQRVREAIDGGGMDGLITARQMVVAGIASFSASGISSPSVQITETPSSPSGLTAAGALGNVILNWGTPTYKGHAYTEVWAHTSDVIGDAVLVGMTAGTSFVHSLGSAATRYYWIRSVNQDGIAGAYNSTNGVQGSTSQDPAYLMDVLAKDYGVTSDAPFFQIDQATTIGGVSIPAGTYMKTAFIHDASITNAKIGAAAVDTAKIADAAITTAKITDANITNAKIANLAVDNAKMANAAITTAKIADAAITSAKITDASITNAKLVDATIELAKINTANISDLAAINADMGTITAGVLKSSDNKFKIDLNNKTITITV